MIDLELVQPIIEDIIKQSLRDKVYWYGLNHNLTNRVATGNLANSISSRIERTQEGVITLQILSLIHI